MNCIVWVCGFVMNFSINTIKWNWIPLWSLKWKAWTLDTIEIEYSSVNHTIKFISITAATRSNASQWNAIKIAMEVVMNTEYSWNKVSLTLWCMRPHISEGSFCAAQLAVCKELKYWHRKHRSQFYGSKFLAPILLPENSKHISWPKKLKSTTKLHFFSFCCQILRYKRVNTYNLM